MENVKGNLRKCNINMHVIPSGRNFYNNHWISKQYILRKSKKTVEFMDVRRRENLNKASKEPHMKELKGRLIQDNLRVPMTND